MDKTEEKSRNTQRRAMAYFKEYCDVTGIHGLRYITEERTMCERLSWIIALVLSIFFCSLMIYQILQKFLHYPVIVTFSMQEVHMNEIPFPAVTICPRSKIAQDHFNITEAVIRKVNNHSLTVDMEKIYNIAATICDFYGTGRKTNVTSDDLYTFLNESRTDIFLYCAYTGQAFPCSNFFTPILTEEGVCYSFNILDKNDIYHERVYHHFLDYHKIPQKSNWDVENGYVEEEVDTYPLRAFRPGAKNGLFIVLQTKRSDIEYDCSSDENGYRVAVHVPSEIPEVAESYFTVPLNQRVTGQIVPRIIKTSAGVKSFDPIKRDCYFQSERSLKFFKKYTQENCLIECKTDFMLQACGCVGFYMPRYNSTPVCVLELVDCMDNVEANFTILNINPSLLDGIEMKPLNCNCLPSCTDLTYGVEISQNNFVYKPHDVEMQLDNRYDYSILNLYFKKNHLETKERNELYGFSDFISNFGGLLGLFTGFSMLSFIEIIYFLSLRIWGNIKLYSNWSGPNE